MYRIRTGEKLHLDNLKTFNEKMQWLKINDRKTIYTMMVDKYAVKKNVAKKVIEYGIFKAMGSDIKIDFEFVDSIPLLASVKRAYTICDI